MSRFIKPFSVILLLLMCYHSTFAQETTSDIQGQITDGNKGIAGATVTVTNPATGTKVVTASRNDGLYNVANLRVGGPYTISVSYVGFKTETQENVFLVLGQEFSANFSLTAETQNLATVVLTTTRQDKVINSNRTGSQEIINRSQLEKLPTVNRSLLDFTKLTPASNGYAFAGQSNQYDNITVDGANFNNSFGLASTLGGQTNSQPISLDALEQIQVSISPYDVRQGGFSGAGINTVTRSGTNTFKGSIYTYQKGPNTQGYGIRTLTIPKQTFSYSLIGGTLGGPIIKDKLFFFVSVEKETRTDPGTSFIASDATHSPNGVSVSNANADTLNALKTFLKNTFNYDPGNFEGYSYKTESKKATFKIDWNINSRNTVTIKYNYLNSFREQQASNSGSVNTSFGRTPGQFAMPFSGSGYRIYNNFNIIIGELNTRFTNKASNKLQVGYTALRDYRQALSSGNFPLVDILDGNGNPYTSFGYEQFTYGNKLNTNVFQISDIFTKYIGKHEVTLGTQNAFKSYLNGFSPAYEGVYRFNNLSDFYASAAPNSATPAARYDLSYVVTPKDSSFPLVGPKDQEYGVFAQDKWRIKKNFTLTYGLRVDIADFQNTFLYNPVVDTLKLFYNGTHVNTGQAPKTSAQFSPRLGFNWDVKGDQTTQIRGGIGLFSGPPPFVWISNQASNSGVALFGSISNGQGYVFSPDINHYRPPVPDTASLQKSYSINVTDPKFKFPQVLKTSVAIDQKLPGNFILTVELSHAKDINAVYFQNINLPSTGFALGGPDNRIRYSATGVYPHGPSSVSNPNIGNAIYMTNINKGYTDVYTIQIQKTFRNLYVNAAYTYMQSKDVMVGGSTASTMWGSKPIYNNPNDATILGYSNAYLPHRVIASASYRKEYAKYFATSVGLLFEAAPSGVGSYVYIGDLNNDGQTSNDLMYIPKTSDKQQYIASQLEASGASDLRTPAQIWAQLDNFIRQDPYLSQHRGDYAKRNELIYPWFKRLDLNVTQDFYLNTKDKVAMKHTLRFSLDIYNFGNFLNKNWGINKIPSAASGGGVLNVGLLKFDKIGPDGKTPIFSFPYADATNQIPYTTSFKDNANSSPSSLQSGTSSFWQMQIGIRYLFN